MVRLSSVCRRLTAQRLGQEQRPRDKRNLYLAAVEGAAVEPAGAGAGAGVVDSDRRKAARDSKDTRDRDKRLKAQVSVHLLLSPHLTSPSLPCLSPCLALPCLALPSVDRRRSGRSCRTRCSLSPASACLCATSAAMSATSSSGPWPCALSRSLRLGLLHLLSNLDRAVCRLLWPGTRSCRGTWRPSWRRRAESSPRLRTQV